MTNKAVPSAVFNATFPVNPSEIISTNILGTENVVECALQNNIQKLIFMSSDKAVNPTNLMGASKLFGEKISKSFTAFYLNANYKRKM